MISKQIAFLESFVSDRRKNLIETIANFRTRYLTVVLEDIYQSQNASAVLRSCESFGVQDVHVIDNNLNFGINPDVTKGSNKWLTIHKYVKRDNNTIAAIDTLKRLGYRIIATSPGNEATSIEQFEVEAGKFALFFGNEHRGLSETTNNRADGCVRIPTFGFTQSLNISVSAAVVLYLMTNKLRNSAIDWKLSAREKNELKLLWLKKSLRKPEIILKEFLLKSANKQPFGN